MKVFVLQVRNSTKLLSPHKHLDRIRRHARQLNIHSKKPFIIEKATSRDTEKRKQLRSKKQVDTRVRVIIHTTENCHLESTVQHRCSLGRNVKDASSAFPASSILRIHFCMTPSSSPSLLLLLLFCLDILSEGILPYSKLHWVTQACQNTTVNTLSPYGGSALHTTGNVHF